MSTGIQSGEAVCGPTPPSNQAAALGAIRGLVHVAVDKDLQNGKDKANRGSRYLKKIRS